MLNEKRQHRLAQRRLVQHDLEEVAAHRRRADHPHHVLSLRSSVSKASRMARNHGTLRMSMSWWIFGGMSDTASSRRWVPIFIATGAGADAAENLPRQALGHHAARRRVQHQRRGVGGGEPVVQPVQPEFAIDGT